MYLIKQTKHSYNALKISFSCLLNGILPTTPIYNKGLVTLATIVHLQAFCYRYCTIDIHFKTLKGQY